MSLKQSSVCTLERSLWLCYGQCVREVEGREMSQEATAVPRWGKPGV